MDTFPNLIEPILLTIQNTFIHFHEYTLPYQTIVCLLLVSIIGVATVFTSKSVDHIIEQYFNTEKVRYRTGETEIKMIRHVTKALVYILGAMLVIYSIPPLRSLSVAMFTGAGIAGIVVGLAAQTTIGNIISGMSLALFQPFRVGDRISIDGKYGKVTDLNLRHTVITTWDNRRLIVPNSKMGDGNVINWTIEEPPIIWPITIGISYDSNMDKAIEIMKHVTSEHGKVMTHRQLLEYDDTIKEDEVVEVLLTELNDFSVDFTIYPWIFDRSVAYKAGCEIREQVKREFDREGIEIPYPHRKLIMSKDEKDIQLDFKK